MSVPVPVPSSTRASAPPAPAGAPTARAPAPPPQNRATPAANANKSRLGGIKRGQLRSSLRFLFYGPEGIGKTTLLADAPDPLLLDIEGGADNIDVARYPFRDEPGGHVPRTFTDVLAAIDDLIANPGHGYATLGIDSVDRLEALIHAHLCETNGQPSIEGFGFGKGYKMTVEKWREMLSRLDTLRTQGVAIIFIGHSFTNTFKNPEGEDFDRYQLHIHKDSGGLIKEWCDVVGFMHFEGGASKLKNDSAQTKRARGWASGRRLVQLAREAAWDAKSRITLPAVLELAVEHPWQPFADAQRGARDATVQSMHAEILAELDRIGAEEFTTAAGRPTTRGDVIALASKSDASTLARILAGLKATTVTTSQEG